MYLHMWDLGFFLVEVEYLFILICYIHSLLQDNNKNNTKKTIKKCNAFQLVLF